MDGINAAIDGFSAQISASERVFRFSSASGADRVGVSRFRSDGQDFSRGSVAHNVGRIAQTRRFRQENILLRGGLFVVKCQQLIKLPERRSGEGNELPSLGAERVSLPPKAAATDALRPPAVADIFIFAECRFFDVVHRIIW